MRKKLKIGMKVGLIDFNLLKNKEVFKEGEIIASRPSENYKVVYAVRLEDGSIDTFTSSELFTKWKKEK